MREYEVTINFGGFVGCEKTYSVMADSQEEAEELALQEAMDDLEVTDVDG